MERKYEAIGLTDDQIVHAVAEFDQLVDRVRRHASDEFRAAFIAHELMLARHRALEARLR